MNRIASVGLAFALSALGCGGEDGLPLGANANGAHRADAPDEEPIPAEPENDEVASEASLDPEDRPTLETREQSEVDVDPAELSEYEVANLAPGYEPRRYPLGPYGREVGGVIADEEFLGWRSPVASNYVLSAAEPVRFSDFYNPEAEGGPELLFVNAVTVWCGVCRAEYVELGALDTEAWRARGLEMLGVLFEDNDGNPATYLDLVNWTRTYGVDFPFVVDPSFKTGIYFDRSATPMNMVIDARTMEIKQLILGYSPQLLDYIDAVLTERGR